VESAIRAAMSDQRISGLSVAVVLNQALAWSAGYGFADLENRVPFTATTVWRLGSVSKPLTAVAAMQLAERGRLDLDAPIQGYCPAFPKKEKPITARELLGHLSGIRHYRKDENFNSTRHYATVSESLEAFKADPLEHEPGSAYTYSTYGYVVLGCVVEGASGASYADYLRENVAKPAGMDRTRPDEVSAVIPDRARGYAKRASGEFCNAELADTSNKVPGGGLVSTSVDLARFAIALETGRLVKPETFQRMLSPMKTTDGKDSPYFGWSIGERHGEKLLSHSGSQQGTSTDFLMIPGKGFAVAIIANTERVDVGKLARELTDILLP
jgi:serine beta-lactamase-like protein LACTB, mitochondrial